MEKRVLLAFFLSSLVLGVWYYFFAPPMPEPSKQPGQPPAAQTNPAPAPEATPSQPTLTQPTTPAPERAMAATPAPAQGTERNVRIETSYWRATFSNRGAVPISWTIKKMPNGHGKEIRGSDGTELELLPPSREILDKLGAPLGLAVSDSQLAHTLNTSTYAISDSSDVIRLGEGQHRELTFTYQDGSVTVAKKFVFFSDRFDFDFSLQALRGNQPIDARLVLGPNFGDQSVTHAGSYITGPQAIADVDGAVQRIAANAISTTEFKGTIDWAGVEDNYFALILIPHNHTGQMDLRGTAQKVMVDGVLQDRHFIASVVPIEQGQTHTIFAGPKDPEILSQIGARIGHPSFEFVINYGIGGTLVKVLVNHFLLPVLNFTYRLIPNYGVAILLITFAINMAFFPLKWKSTIKMKKAQAMQPKMKELQDKMKGLKKDDPKMQELQTEQLRMMREANPFGGCLPMLVQLPFFWAFFVLLTVSIDVRQAPFFGWIDNLTAPDTLHLLGFDLHVLPIAMCLSWVAQTFIMPMPGSTDPSQAAQQKIQKIMMGVVMPVIFTVFFFWQAPSGLVLYWMFNSLVGVGQQLVINRLMPAAPPDDINKEPQPKKGKSSAKSVATTR